MICFNSTYVDIKEYINLYKDKNYLEKYSYELDIKESCKKLSERLELETIEIRDNTVLFLNNKDKKIYIGIFDNKNNIREINNIHKYIKNEYATLYSDEFIIYEIDQDRLPATVKISFIDACKKYYLAYRYINKKNEKRIIRNVIDSVIILDSLIVTHLKTVPGDIESNIAELCIIFKAPIEEIFRVKNMFKKKGIDLDIEKIKQYIKRHLYRIELSTKTNKEQLFIENYETKARFIYETVDSKDLCSFITKYDNEIEFSNNEFRDKIY